MDSSIRFPDFLVVGSVKCGTTSLHYYLSQHPEVHVSRPKELNFFLGKDTLTEEEAASTSLNWHRGTEWYGRHFRTDKPVCGELSPLYVDASWLPVTFERMARLVPDARLILMVREPLDRLWSHFLMQRLNAWISPLSFAEFVEAPSCQWVQAYSDYGTQLQTILKHFPRDAVLVVESKSLDDQREETLRQIFRFLGVDPSYRSPAFERRIYEAKRRRFPSLTGHRILQSSWMTKASRRIPFTLFEPLRNLLLVPFSSAKPTRELPPASAQRLHERYRHEVALLRELSGQPFPSLELPE